MFTIRDTVKTADDENDGDVAARNVASTQLAEQDHNNESTLSVATAGLSMVIDLKATVVIEHLIQASGAF